MKNMILGIVALAGLTIAAPTPAEAQSAGHYEVRVVHERVWQPARTETYRVKIWVPARVEYRTQTVVIRPASIRIDACGVRIRIPAVTRTHRVPVTIPGCYRWETRTRTIPGCSLRLLFRDWPPVRPFVPPHRPSVADGCAGAGPARSAQRHLAPSHPTG